MVKTRWNMKRAKLKKGIAFAVLILILGGFIGFVEKQNLSKSYHGLDIEIQGISGVYFVEEAEIEEIIESTFPELRAGLNLNRIPLKQIETRLSGHPFVKSVESYIGQKGIVKINIEQHQPIARLVRPLAAHGYITKEGKVIPTSSSYTSRSLILEGRYAEYLMEIGEIDEKMPELLGLIRFITEDEFWNAQITSVELNSRTDIRLYQQVGNQAIEFGDAHDVESKFERIQLFYKEILPRKGWNTYSRVSVKYKDQIVCE
jgi:cell division protein FtsQ